MKKLIVYSSKTGTTEKCAGILGQNLIDATIINLATMFLGTPSQNSLI